MVMNQKKIVLQTFTYLFLLLCIVIALYPLVWVVLSSFRSNQEILSGTLSLPESFSFRGYIEALTITPILDYFWNSVIIATTSTLLNVFFLSKAGYIFARFDFRGKDTLYFVLLLSLVIPGTALLQPVSQLIHNLGLYDTRFALILVYTAFSIPMSLLILRVTYSNIPKELEEAAAIDGAGFVRTYFQIMMPCAKTGLTSAAVLAFLRAWNEFLFALVLTRGHHARTLPLSLSFFTAQFSFNYTALFAAVTIAVIPSILVFAIFQEQIVSSLTAGSVK